MHDTVPQPASMRLDGLQVGRALAALTVVLAHAVDHPLKGHISEAWQLGARYGVTLFFVISGFIMVHTTGTGAFNPGRFISRRLRRVVPIYWVVTLLVAAAALLVPTLFQRTVFDWQHLAFSLLFIPMYDPAGTGGIWPMFRLGWTLNYEMFFYFAFAATFALGLVKRAIAITLFFLALIALGLMIDFQAAIPAFYTRIDTLGFVAGVWLGVLNFRGLLRPALSTIALLFLGSIAILWVIAADYHALRPIPATQAWLVVACTAHAALLLILVDKRGWQAPRPLLFVGDASYSIYLFHMFAIGAVTAVIRRLPEQLLVPMVAVSAIAGCAVGMAAYQFIERRLNLLMRGKRPLTAAQIDAGASTAPPSAHEKAS